MSRKKLLFYVHVSSHLKSFFKLIQRLQSNENYEPIVFLNLGNGWDLTKDVIFCQQNSIQYIFDSEGLKRFTNKIESDAPPAVNPYYTPTPDQNSNKLINRIKRSIKKYFPIFVFWNYSKNRIKEFTLMLKVNQISAVILPEDHYQNQALMVRAAKKINIPSILIPWAKCNHEDVVQVCRVEIKGLRKVFCALFPKWKIRFKGEDIMPFKVWEIIVMKILRVAPVKPFLRWGGRSDVMIIENTDDLKYYTDLDLSKDKMKKTGAVYQDVFFEILNQQTEYKKKIFEKYNIVDNRPIILVNLFPIGTQVDGQYSGFDYNSLREAINFWLDPLLNLDKFQVWINHHPRTVLEFVKYIEKLNLKVIYEPIEDILPFCDLFVTGVSATTRMALTLGKPIVCITEGNLYTDLDNFKSSLIANTKDEYLSIIKKIGEDDVYFNRLKDYAKDDAKNFGPIDGKSFDRLLDLMDSIIK